jgi:long-chain acyl-CoA synthetase
LAKNCHRYQEAFLAAARLGAVLIPLNYRLSARELREILADSGAQIILVAPMFAQAWETIRDQLPQVRHVILLAEHAYDDVIAYEELVQTSTTVAPYHERSPDDLLYLLYTSGTTGRPKGVMLSEQNALLVASGVQPFMRLTQNDRVLRTPNPFHLGGLTIWQVLPVGGCMLVMPEFEPAGYLRMVQNERATVMTLAPTMINAMINLPEVHAADLSSLRLLGYAAAPMPEHLLHATAETFGRAGLLQAYGMTETGYVTVLRPDDHVLAESGAAARRIRSVGRAIPGIELRVVDSQDEDVTCGEIGEIVVRGPSVMLGYWNQPKATAEALRGGWMHTGDMGSLDEDGYLYLADRKKDMIISGGENVYSTEVEAVLYEHPAVLEAAVIGVPDPVWGETVKALVVLKPARTATAQGLQTFCRERIAGYKIPRSVEFLETLPKTATGKISKNDLRAPYWQSPS